MVSTTALETLKQELAQKRAEATALEQAIAVLSGGALMVVDSNSTLPTAKDFEGLGIADAAKRYIQEMGGVGQSTGVLAKVLLQRGIHTRSKNWTATVYSTLDNSGKFTRVNDVWTLKPEEVAAANAE